MNLQRSYWQCQPTVHETYSLPIVQGHRRNLLLGCKEPYLAYLLSLLRSGNYTLPRGVLFPSLHATDALHQSRLEQLAVLGSAINTGSSGDAWQDVRLT